MACQARASGGVQNDSSAALGTEILDDVAMGVKGDAVPRIYAALSCGRGQDSLAELKRSSFNFIEIYFVVYPMVASLSTRTRHVALSQRAL